MPSSSRSASSGSGKTSANERKVWQAAHNRPDRSATHNELKDACPDLGIEEILHVVNSLLAKSLFTASKTATDMYFTAVSKSEASVVGGLENEERIIYQFIKEADNEGIWTKQLKSKSNLHQTVMTRGLKSLEQKSLIKTVKSVKFPTRKIYMLSNLTPSIELSGGPWYTDNELDAEFIGQISNLLYRYIASETWPRKDEDDAADLNPLYPCAHTPSLPTAPKCLKWMTLNKVTPIQLNVENVQTLLDMLIYDGRIEKIPCFQNFTGGGGRSKKVYDDWTPDGKKEGYDTVSESESESGSESGSSSGSESESKSDSDDDRSSRKRKKGSSKSKSKSRKKSKRSGSASSSRSSKKKSSSSSSKRSGSKSRSSSSSKRKVKDESDEETDDDEEEEDEGPMEVSTAESGLYVYRALRPMRVQAGWTEVPCGACPIFDFCEPTGPVNAGSCVYLDKWIEVGGAGDEEEEDEDDEDEGGEDEESDEEGAKEKKGAKKQKKKRVDVEIEGEGEGEAAEEEGGEEEGGE